MSQPVVSGPSSLCGGCGGSLQTGARFCPACGRAVPVAMHCASCGVQLAPTAHFCPQCGRPAAIASQPPPQPFAAPPTRFLAPSSAGSFGRQPRAAGRTSFTLSAPIVVAAAGFIIALFGLLLPWASIEVGGNSTTVGAFDENATYRLSDWLSSDTQIDGLAVLAAGLAGVFVMLLGATSNIASRQALSIAATVGGAMFGLALLNMQFLWSFEYVSPSYGLFALALGGLLPTVARWIAQVHPS